MGAAAQDSGMAKPSRLQRSSNRFSIGVPDSTRLCSAAPGDWAVWEFGSYD
jgi:hypothetical protein